MFNKNINELNKLFIIGFFCYISFLIMFSAREWMPKAINYSAVFLSLYYIARINYRVSSRAMLIAILSIIILYINLILAYMPSIKWSFNWLGFMLIFVAAATAVKNMNYNNVRRFENTFSKNLALLSAILAMLMVYSIILSRGTFIKYLSMLFFENLIANFIMEPFGITQQGFSTFIMLVILWLIVSRRIHKSLFVQCALIATILISLAFIPASRTTILSTTLMITWFIIFSRKRNLIMVAAKTAVLFIIPIVLYLLLTNADVQSCFDRLASMNFAIHSTISYPFGLGNGGYHMYVASNSGDLLLKFGNKLMLRGGSFWGSPESDIVYFIGSWGWLSVFFFGFSIYLLVKSAKIVCDNPHINLFDRLFIYCGWYTIFAGITQYRSGSPLWWATIGALYGVIIKYDRKRFRSSSVITAGRSVFKSTVVRPKTESMRVQ